MKVLTVFLSTSCRISKLGVTLINETRETKAMETEERMERRAEKRNWWLQSGINVEPVLWG